MAPKKRKYYQEGIQAYYRTKKPRQSYRDLNPFHFKIDDYAGLGSNWMHGDLPPNSMVARAARYHDWNYEKMQKRFGMQPYYQYNFADEKMSMQMDKIIHSETAPAGQKFKARFINALWNFKKKYTKHLNWRPKNYSRKNYRERLYVMPRYRSRVYRKKRFLKRRSLKRYFSKKRYGKKRRFSRRSFNKKRINYVSAPRTRIEEADYIIKNTINKMCLFAVGPNILGTRAQIKGDVEDVGLSDTVLVPDGNLAASMTYAQVITRIKNLSLHPTMITVYKCVWKQQGNSGTYTDGFETIFEHIINGLVKTMDSDDVDAAISAVAADRVQQTNSVWNIQSKVFQFEPNSSDDFKLYYKILSKKRYYLRSGDELMVRLRRKKPYHFPRQDLLTNTDITDFWIPKLSQFMFFKNQPTIGYSTADSTIPGYPVVSLGVTTFRKSVFRIRHAYQKLLAISNVKAQSATDVSGPSEAVEQKDDVGD